MRSDIMLIDVKRELDELSGQFEELRRHL